MSAQNAARQRGQPWHGGAEPHVRLLGVSKRFGDFLAIDNVSLDIYRSEFFALLGPSGCGKTTLLRMLAGFEQPSSGGIVLAGEDVSSVPPYRRPVNMMFQSYALFPHMTVERNIAFGLRQDGLAAAEIARRVAEVVEMVQLGAFVKRKPHQLSGGQRQRVALARSIVKRPQLLLLDEPLGALDKKLREQTQFELMNIQDELGITFVIVTHDQEEAMTVSSRIAVMDHGRVVQVAPPVEIYEHPGSRYVAEFIGDVNIFEGEILEDNALEDKTLEDGTQRGAGRTLIRLLDAEAVLAVDRAVDAAPGSRVWAALRPEKLSVALQPPAEARVNCLRGEVWDIGYLGNLSIYHVKLPGGRMLTATRANTERDEHRISWEDTVYLSWRESAAVVLHG